MDGTGSARKDSMVRKKISDQQIFKEADDAETTKEIMQHKNLATERQAYRFMDNLAAQGMTVVACQVWRKDRTGTMKPVPGYYIREGETD